VPLIDLRKRFGLWDRCGQTSYWRLIGLPEYQLILVDPLHGRMITAFDHPYVGGPAKAVVVRESEGITEKDLERAYDRNQPWVKMILEDFFTGMGAVAAGVVKETPESFFLKHYEDQTKKYKETGEGHSGFTGKDELLMATKKVLGALEERVVVLRKIILREELDEFLESYGILEC
jgi:hypothetical protein